MLYLDTSAFLKLYVREEGSEAVQALVSGQPDPLPIPEFLQMEIYNALYLKVFWGELPESEALRLHDLFEDRKTKGLYFVPEIGRAELMAEFRRLASHTSTLGCRTMDVIHVACACQLNPKRFLSFDSRQNQLAEVAGLTLARVIP